MRTWLAALGLVALGTFIAAAAEPETENVAQYRVAFRVIKGSGKHESTLASPTVVTLEGKPAYVRIGGMLTPPRGADGAGPIEYGTTLMTIVKCYHGQPFVDASITEVQPDVTDPDSVRISGFTARVFEKVTFDKPIVIKVKDASDVRCEITVSKFEPEAAKTE